jgi:2,4-dienoyl-CoA reductase-like NADH-dependent reductase (Old Yellow Enzyme family)
VARPPHLPLLSPARHGLAHTADWREVPFETPNEISLAEIPTIVHEYRGGARNALAAGFDGVELHAANGYLIDQFLRNGVNNRNDRYRGSVENRSRFLVRRACSTACGCKSRPNLMEVKGSEAQGLRREVRSEGSVKQRYGPMNKNRI